MDKRTDGQTDRPKTICPDLSLQRHKKNNQWQWEEHLFEYLWGKSLGPMLIKLDSILFNRVFAEILKPHLCLTLPKQALVFTCLQCKSFKNTVRKGEIDCYTQFLFSQSVFYSFLKLSALSNSKLSSARSFS